MKQVKILSLLFLLMIATSIMGFAQDNKTKEVEAAVSKLTKAMLDSDVPALTAITSDNLTYGHSSGKVQNKTEFLESFRSGASDFVKIDIKEQTIYFIKNTAIVRHILDAATNDNKQPGHTTLKIMTVWEKMGKQWILIARQAVKSL